MAGGRVLGTARPCPFCKLAAGTASAEMVLRRDGLMVVLDRRPLVEGHCLVVPTEHVETMLELPDERIGQLFSLAKRVAAALASFLAADGALILVNNKVSQSVPHLHVHVVPRTFGDGLFSKPFFWSRRKYPDAEAGAQIAARLRAALESG
ncbi:MAG: HIT family protein [Cyanobacteria bacterium REEB65]|nr:HIT family protein [Cyanobacteria bacterium REEB65]